MLAIVSGNHEAVRFLVVEDGADLFYQSLSVDPLLGFDAAFLVTRLTELHVAAIRDDVNSAQHILNAHVSTLDLIHVLPRDCFSCFWSFHESFVHWGKGVIIVLGGSLIVDDITPS